MSEWTSRSRQEKDIEEKRAKTAKPEDFADIRFIKELDESGFIDDLIQAEIRGSSPMLKLLVGLLTVFLLQTSPIRRTRLESVSQT